MKKIYFTVGPSELFPTVRKHILQAVKNDIGSISHRGSIFQELYQTVINDLKKLLNIPNEYEIFFLSSGTEGMERVIQNGVEKYSYHVVHGTFSKRFYEVAKELGKKAESISLKDSEISRLSTILIPKKAELVAFTHNETNNGLTLPLSEIYKLKKKNKDKLFAMDIVSSVPYVDVDYSVFDYVFFSVQKGFGLPAGLGIIIVSPKALKKSVQLAQKNVSIGSYHSFASLLKYREKLQTPETPNVWVIYLFSCVLKDMLKIGISRIRQETEEKAALIYKMIAANKNYTLLTSDKNVLSQTVMVVNVKGGSKKIRDSLKKKGIIVGSGYGDSKDIHIRIGNFPALSITHVKKLVKALNQSRAL